MAACAIPVGLAYMAYLAIRAVVTGCAILGAAASRAVRTTWRHLAQRRASRAARRTRWRHLGGVRGLLGRRAWARLVRTPRSLVPPTAIDMVWRSWIRDPDDEGWALLSRWWPERARTELMAAAADPVSRDGDRAALIAFCVRHALAPDEPAERARFYTLTGQPGQRRALDPDGALVAAAYRAADERTRAALREALAGEGDLDVLRVVVAGTGSASRVPAMTAAELDYLTGHLADRRDWAGLWALARELPVVDAARTVALIGPGWRPDRQRDRELHALLSEVSPGARGALCAGTAVRIEIPGRVVAGALSSGGTRLAVAVVQGAVACVGVYRVPGGQLVALHRLPARGFLALAYADGKHLIVVDSAAGPVPGKPTRMYRCPDRSRPELIAQEDYSTVAVTAGLRGLATISASGVLALHDRDGENLGSSPIGFPMIESSRIRAVSDLSGGRVVVGVRDPARARLFLVEARQARAARVVAMADLRSPATGIVLHGRDHVIIAAPDQVERWQVNWRWPSLGGTRLRMVAESRAHGAQDLVLVAARDEVCALDSSGAVSYLNPVSLTSVPKPRELTGMRGTALWSTADNSCHALAGDGVVTVVTRELIALQELADRPQAAWGPADMATLARAAPLIGQRPAARPLYTVLAGALEHRLAGDVRLGTAAGTAGWARDDDIAIGDDAPDEILQEAGA